VCARCVGGGAFVSNTQKYSPLGAKLKPIIHICSAGDSFVGVFAG
jgi:hypothetical protein